MTTVPRTSGVRAARALVVEQVRRRLAGGLRTSAQGDGNTLDIAGSARLRNVAIRFEGSDNRVVVAPGVRLRGVSLLLKGSRQTIRIEEDAKIDDDSHLIARDDDSRIEVGPATTVERARLIALGGTRVRLGADCMLAYDVELRSGDSHSVLDAASGERLNPAADIEVADHVWLGARVTVLKGSRIGSDSVVGCGSIVRGDFEPGVALAGVPARVVRRGITWSRERL